MAFPDPRSWMAGISPASFLAMAAVLGLAALPAPASAERQGHGRHDGGQAAQAQSQGGGNRGSGNPGGGWSGHRGWGHGNSSASARRAPTVTQSEQGQGQGQSQAQGRGQGATWSRPERSEPRVREARREGIGRQPNAGTYTNQGQSAADWRQAPQATTGRHWEARNRAYADGTRNRAYADQTRNRSYREDGRNAEHWRDGDGRHGDRWRKDGWRRDRQAWHRGNHRQWNRDWRHNDRYDWHSYRSHNRHLYHAGRYYAPYRGYGYRRLSIGLYLDSLFYSSRYWIDDPWYYRLPPADGPYRWVRYYDDALLVDIYSGEVVDVIHDFFW